MELVVEEFTQKKGGLGGMGYMVVWRSLADGAKSGSAVISRTQTNIQLYNLYFTHLCSAWASYSHTFICYLRAKLI